MAKNREMLKEAIAEAKAVKEMAIANAKAALEEAFTPQLKSMLSLKLQEMEMEDEDLKEYSEEHEDPETGRRVTAKDVTETEDDLMEVDLEELLAELGNEEMDESLNEAEDEEGEDEEDEEGEGEGEPLDLEDMTDEDLKKLIEDVIAAMVASGELEAGHEGGEEEGEEIEMSDEEEVDLAELLKEIEEMEQDEMYEADETTNPEEKKIEAAFAKITESLDSLKEEAFPSGPELAAILGGIAAIVASAGGYVALRSYAERKAKEGSEKWQKILKVVNGLGSAAGGATRIDETEEELAEAKSTIKTLRSELNEINLLNAKLLYSNKIFKSKNLNENQKVKVLSSFDKAKNVGEVKMVFETLNEGIKVKKETIKENLGRASKATITPTAKQPIVESNDVFKRMQKLAGII
jgi:hypothetical protein